jgi:subtilase family serine protease
MNSGDEMENLSARAKTTLYVIVLLMSLGTALPAAAVVTKGFEPLLIGEPLSTTNPGVAPFTPQQVWKAYDFGPLYNAGDKGAGTVIVIVDAYGSGTITTDVATFCSQFSLPSCTLKIYYPDGRPRRGNSGWAVETSLDVEWAHAIAPQATIALAVAYDSSFAHIYDAISYAVNKVSGATVISMSFGAIESDFPTTGSYTISAHHALFAAAANKGISMFASSGDSGATTANSILYPASDPLVTAVGGTSLYLNSTGSYSSETTWSGSGAGASIVFSKPSYQTGLGDSMRDIADVAYDADPNTGFYVRSSPYWYEVGGTSCGAPQWAALFAVAVQYHSHTYGSQTNPDLYNMTSGVYHDITTGNDGYYSAGTGWDYPTGWGTPDANLVVSHLP